MPEYDIIIPHYGFGVITQLALRCLQTIRQYSENYRLIFVDNASPEFDAIWEELKQHQHLLIRNTENLGFLKATNTGMQLSTAPYVVLMNNDTEAVPGWLPALRLPFSDAECVGLSGPRTTASGSWQGRWKGRGGTLILNTHAMLAFFCVMISRVVINKVGYLDEEFGVGFGDDDMYCHLAHRHGFRLALVQDLVIPHHHRSTFHAMYGEEKTKHMQDIALALFHRKVKAWRR